VSLSRFERFVLRLPPALQAVALALQLLWEEWILLILFNLLWLLAWLTILLGPPATFAVYHVAHRTVEGRKILFGDLLAGIRRYFVLSWLWMLANLFVVLVLFYAYLFYAEGTHLLAQIAQMIMLVGLLVWVALQFYTVPSLMAQEEKSLRLAWYMSWLMIWKEPGYTLVLLLTTTSLMALILLTQGLAFVLGGASLLALIGAQAIARHSKSRRGAG
jgi:hypothetical protein